MCYMFWVTFLVVFFMVEVIGIVVKYDVFLWGRSLFLMCYVLVCKKMRSERIRVEVVWGRGRWIVVRSFFLGIK